MSRRLLLPMLVLLAAFLVLEGCGGSGLQTMRQQQKLKEDVSAAKAQGGIICSPREMAIAEAHLAFAILEMKEGDGRRAIEHLETTEANIRAVNTRLRTCAPEPMTAEVIPPADSDGDGLLDTMDGCPNQPEDFDGVEDDDGCPEGPRDRDGDGITDAVDQCPDQPEDLDGIEDEDGCPDLAEDKDGDGIADTEDRCPDQPEDFDRYQDGDGCPDVDNDGDSIFDVVDMCPDDAEDIDGFEDQDGCPDGDNDQDGLGDSVDRCPTEPETINGYQDADGCPDSKPELPARVTVTKTQIKISEKINFETGSSVIIPVSYSILDDVVKVLKAYPRIHIRIEGHTDSQGSEVFNLNLSKKRSASVRTYLVTAGIESERIGAVGLGESQPIDDNATPEGRAANRRVEFHITEQ